MRLNFWHFAEDRLLSINRMNPETVPLFYFVNAACAVIRPLKGRWVLLEGMNDVKLWKEEKERPLNHFSSSVQPQGLNDRPSGLLFTISCAPFLSIHMKSMKFFSQELERQRIYKICFIYVTALSTRFCSFYGRSFYPQPLCYISDLQWFWQWI